ncbi:hypothetical protein OIO90_006204 [Microbotryomycetes sp. JL221]|nr:hypothetical protein OIO90_006204 [Microbotryomycetes sp. JL221]
MTELNSQDTEMTNVDDSMPQSQTDASQEDDSITEPATVFPSVKLDAPLVSSYTYHSTDDEHKRLDQDDSDKAAPKTNLIDGEWILGVDEAGRGPVLGPQVYGIAFCRSEYSDPLKSLGFADSKTLKDSEREELFNVILQHEQDVKFAVTVMSPNDISAGMLRRTPYDLNSQSHDVTIDLIRQVVDRGYNVREAYVDTVGPPDKYQMKLSGLFPTIKFTVTSKADALFPIVSAASIVAKVTRDKVLNGWQWLEPGREELEYSRPLGSGYPGDPKTIAWLDNNVDKVFGYPNIVRFSWATVRDRMKRNCATVKWQDEPLQIQKYFSAETTDETGRVGGGQKALWQDLGLTSVGAF